MRHRVETALGLARLGIPSLLAQRPRPRPPRARPSRGEAVPGTEIALGRLLSSPACGRRPTQRATAARLDLEQLLIATSRTFALAIPLLPEPTRREVTLSYLLFRIADTFEDAASLAARPAHRGAGAVRRACSRAPDPEEIAEVARALGRRGALRAARLPGAAGRVPAVLDAFFALSPRAVALIREHTRAHGRGHGRLRRPHHATTASCACATSPDLQDYCYVVAGIVGELLTELFLLGRPPLAAGRRRRLRRALARLRRGAPARQHPQGLGLRRHPRAALPARRRRARRGDGPGAARPPGRGEYVLTLQGAGAERGLVAFNALPVRLALATLDRLETAGPGSKLTRPEVYAIVQRMHGALDRGEPAIDLPASLSV